jgi:hypothetical protein
MLHESLLEGLTACSLRFTIFGVQYDIVVGITAANCMAQTSKLTSFKKCNKFL